MQTKIKQLLKDYWGFENLKPFQKESIETILSGKDSLTILPTGGGKSLCFQLPVLFNDGIAIIISPLISLMKDQVDSLNDIGIPTRYLNSSLSAKEKSDVFYCLQNETIKLLYIAPERLEIDSTLEFLKNINIQYFVIDEAHCISHWGHDFRSSYLNLKNIKQNFENIPIHAFTATATKQVQNDIKEQLNLHNPSIFIAPVDRENLTYRVYPRNNILTQIIDILNRHPNEAGIIYCLRRKDSEKISAKLNEHGFNTLPYHAGLSRKERYDNQTDFSLEKVDIIVATVAFGMGIDRSNIRFILHAAMPKSIEFFQQETGRAGRDGLPAFCYMFYSGQDYQIWKHLYSESSRKDIINQKLSDIYNFCTRPTCKHKTITEYFNQKYDKEDCNACDYCLGEVEMVDNPIVIGQKILSCIYRVNQRFGANQITGILKGSTAKNIMDRNHNKLSTYGIMKDKSISYIRFMIDQLVDQNYILRTGEYSILKITQKGWKLIKGNLSPVLVKPQERQKKKEIRKKQRLIREQEWADIDTNLFELLRKKRSEIAHTRRVPAYIIFSDKSLKDMTLLKPTTKEAFANVFGVGKKKVEYYADIFIEIIKNYS